MLEIQNKDQLFFLIFDEMGLDRLSTEREIPDQLKNRADRLKYQNAHFFQMPISQKLIVK